MKICLTNQLENQNYKLSTKNIKSLLKVAKMTLLTEDIKRAYNTIPTNLELSLTLTDDQGIMALNRKYRGKNQATDVLSFPQYEPGAKILPKTSLGDIVISVETMAKQAKAYGHCQNRELCFLFVHGLLHLLGYDHELGRIEDNLQQYRQTEVLDILAINR